MKTQITAEFTNNIEALYLDYVNNFISVSAFAQHYCISDKAAETIISLGRLINTDQFINEDCK